MSETNVMHCQTECCVLCLNFRKSFLSSNWVTSIKARVKFPKVSDPWVFESCPNLTKNCSVVNVSSGIINSLNKFISCVHLARGSDTVQPKRLRSGERGSQFCVTPSPNHRLGNCSFKYCGMFPAAIAFPNGEGSKFAKHRRKCHPPGTAGRCSRNSE
jgi:hypothetical protein